MTRGSCCIPLICTRSVYTTYSFFLFKVLVWRSWPLISMPLRIENSKPRYRLKLKYMSAWWLKSPQRWAISFILPHDINRQTDDTILDSLLKMWVSLGHGVNGVKGPSPNFSFKVAETIVAKISSNFLAITRYYVYCWSNITIEFNTRCVIGVELWFYGNWTSCCHFHNHAQA